MGRLPAGLAPAGGSRAIAVGGLVRNPSLLRQLLPSRLGLPAPAQSSLRF